MLIITAMRITTRIHEFRGIIICPLFITVIENPGAIVENIDTPIDGGLVTILLY